MKEKLATASRQQLQVAAAVGVVFLVIALAVVFRPGLTEPVPTIVDEGTITHERTSSARIADHDTDSPSNAQFVDLFDGKSLDGWESEGGDDWTAEDGILTGRGNSLLVYTKEEFKDVRVTC